jgi:hypothetical protein
MNKKPKAPFFLKGQELDAYDYIKQEPFFYDKKINTYRCIVENIDKKNGLVDIKGIGCIKWTACISIEDANKYLKYPKNRPKFKKGEIVLAKHIDGKAYEFVIDSVKEQLLMENLYGCYIINDKYKLIYEFQENSLNSTGNSIVSKPKWSVGTYVEILETCISNGNRFEKGDVFVLIPRNFSSNNLNMALINSSKKWSPVMYGHTATKLEEDGVIKWHENKPEKKIDIFPQKGENAKDVIERLKKYNIFWAEGSDECVDEWMKNKLLERYSNGKTMLQVELDMYRKCFPMTPNECCFNILQKPEIKISKQKRIKININKPII